MPSPPHPHTGSNSEAEERHRVVADDAHSATENAGPLSEVPHGVTRRASRLTEPGTPESRMRGNLHVRFGGGPLEKGSGNGLPRWWPTQLQLIPVRALNQVTYCPR